MYHTNSSLSLHAADVYIRSQHVHWPAQGRVGSRVMNREKSLGLYLFSFKIAKISTR